MSTFVDCHCHLFNMIDIPLYSTLKNDVSVKTIYKLFASLGIIAPTPILNKIVGKKIESYEDLIRFFEREIDVSIEWLSNQIFEAIKNLDEYDDVLITPLVMDFDKINGTIKYGEPTAEKQLFRLLKAIEVANVSDKIKVCPFLGFDLRKLEDTEYDALQELKNTWNKYSASLNERKSLDTIKSGKVIGIKLYPPIGFNPYPKKDSVQKRYIGLYSWCCEQQIPITVHCQESSYMGGNIQRKVNGITHPANWAKLFKNNKDLKNLKINFAHFGGDEGFDDMFEPINPFNQGIDKDSWTYIIIQMLRKYPNTFSDIAAYSYASKKSRKNFTKLIERAYKDKLSSGDYSLVDKIIWGSDIPMILDDESCHTSKGFQYKLYYKNFLECIEKADEIGSSEIKKISKKISSKNTLKFLLSK